MILKSGTAYSKKLKSAWLVQLIIYME